MAFDVHFLLATIGFALIYTSFILIPFMGVGDKLPTAIFAGGSVSAYLLSQYLGPPFIYMSFGVISVVTIFLMLNFCHKTTFVARIAKVCVAFLVVDFAGWYAFQNNYSPIAFNCATLGLYLWAIIEMVKGDGSFRKLTYGAWNAFFPRATRVRYSDRERDQKNRAQW